MTNKRFADACDSIEDSPGQAENMKLRSELMIAFKAHLVCSKLTQGQVAKLFGVTRPRVSDLMRGRINRVALDALVDRAVAAGLRVKMSLRKAA